MLNKEKSVEQKSLGVTLGLPKNELELYNKVNRGIAGSSVKKLAKWSKIDADTWANILSIASDQPRRMLPNDSEKVALVVKVLDAATECFGSKEDALKWMGTPAFELKDRKPIDMLGSAMGASMVLNLINKIQYGVY